MIKYVKWYLTISSRYLLVLSKIFSIQYKCYIIYNAWSRGVRKSGNFFLLETTRRKRNSLTICSRIQNDFMLNIKFNSPWRVHFQSGSPYPVPHLTFFSRWMYSVCMACTLSRRHYCAWRARFHVAIIVYSLNSARNVTWSWIFRNWTFIKRILLGL